jgi:hypothetical protein
MDSFFMLLFFLILRKSVSLYLGNCFKKTKVKIYSIATLLNTVINCIFVLLAYFYIYFFNEFLADQSIFKLLLFNLFNLISFYLNFNIVHEIFIEKELLYMNPKSIDNSDQSITTGDNSPGNQDSIDKEKVDREKNFKAPYKPMPKKKKTPPVDPSTVTGLPFTSPEDKVKKITEVETEYIDLYEEAAMNRNSTEVDTYANILDRLTQKKDRLKRRYDIITKSDDEDSDEDTNI